MDQTIFKMSLSNLSTSGFDAFNFSVIGMLVVFGGLSFIALYIALLPRILNGFSRLKRKLSVSRQEESVREDQQFIDDETLIAIATALHLHQFSGSDNRKITWKRHGLWDSSWQRAGRFEAMNRQGHIVAPRR